MSARHRCLRLQVAPTFASESPSALHQLCIWSISASGRSLSQAKVDDEMPTLVVAEPISGDMDDSLGCDSEVGYGDSGVGDRDTGVGDRDTGVGDGEPRKDEARAQSEGSASFPSSPLPSSPSSSTPSPLHKRKRLHNSAASKPTKPEKQSRSLAATSSEKLSPTLQQPKPAPQYEYLIERVRWRETEQELGLHLRKEI